jgi:hypothetical protein
MKKFLLCSFLLCLLNSCSTDSDFSSSEPKENIIKSNGNLSLPENESNPFDYKGKQYFDALTVYDKQNQFPNSIQELTKQIRFINSNFSKGQFTNKNLILFNDQIVESIMNDPDNNMIAIIENSTLGSEAKTSLINFLQNLMIKRELEFSVIYAYIVAYENSIVNSSTWSVDERDTILTVTSISRYSLYSESERKDRDWESSAGNKQTKPFFSHNETTIISIIALLETIL